MRCARRGAWRRDGDGQGRGSARQQGPSPRSPSASAGGKSKSSIQGVCQEDCVILPQDNQMVVTVTL